MRQPHAAALAAHGFDPAGQTELMRHLHQVRRGNVVGFGDLGNGA
jgi:hypothetical protein